MSGDTPVRPRPGGRTARNREAVHNAVRELFAEGRTGPTVREIAARSGVHEVTIYRRWGAAENVVLDVAVTELNEQSPVPATGDLRADLRAWAEAVATMLRTPEGFAFMDALVAARPGRLGPAPHDTDQASVYLRQRVDQIQATLDRAAEHGVPTPTVGTVLDVIIAPLYLRAYFGYLAPESDLAELVERALASARDW